MPRSYASETSAPSAEPAGPPHWLSPGEKRAFANDRETSTGSRRHPRRRRRGLGSLPDPEAPIFQTSDLGIVGDTMKVLPALIEELEKRKDG
jgi:hypothetical protein